MKNLCFDEGMRAAIDKAGYVPKIVENLTVPKFR